MKLVYVWLRELQTLYMEGSSAVLVVLMQDLLNLRELNIENYEGLQEVFKLEGLLTREGEQQNMVLIELKKMKLCNLLELRCIWKGPTQLINLKNLQNLKVFGCKKLIHLFTPTLARSLQNLTLLKIKRCDKLEHLIVEDEEDQILSERHLQTLCFPNLCFLNVTKCNKLKFLFPVMIAHNLLKLSSLNVEDASQLVEVFAHEDEGDKSVQKDITLPKLKDVTLKQLPSLLNFFPRNCNVILPRLHKLQVQSCPNMTKSFAPTPDKNVHVNGEVTHYTWSFYFFLIYLLCVTWRKYVIQVLILTSNRIV